MRAIGKWVTIAAICRISYLGQTLGTACGIRTDIRPCVSLLTINNRKIIRYISIQQGYSTNKFNMCQWWRIHLQTIAKVIQRIVGTPSLNHDTLGIIPHLPPKFKFLRQSPHKWSKTDPLNSTIYPDNFGFAKSFIAGPFMLHLNAPCRPYRGQRTEQYAER